MRVDVNPPPKTPQNEPSPFDVWFSRTLKDAYERVVHEPVPADILAALPPSQN